MEMAQAVLQIKVVGAPNQRISESIKKYFQDFKEFAHSIIVKWNLSSERADQVQKQLELAREKSFIFLSSRQRFL
ncbi:MAG: hypothetical protein AB7O96_13950 [Pseudobdellovibrionaceae bacterium]